MELKNQMYCFVCGGPTENQFFIFDGVCETIDELLILVEMRIGSYFSLCAEIQLEEMI